jgi:hypothetical protein
MLKVTQAIRSSRSAITTNKEKYSQNTLSHTLANTTETGIEANEIGDIVHYEHIHINIKLLTSLANRVRLEAE